jgi:hypothetical protein
MDNKLSDDNKYVLFQHRRDPSRVHVWSVASWEKHSEGVYGKEWNVLAESNDYEELLALYKLIKAAHMSQEQKPKLEYLTL